MRINPIYIPGKVCRFASRAFHKLRTWHAPEYRNPDNAELKQIELRCLDLQMPSQDFVVDVQAFNRFVQQAGFPVDYHGGIHGGVFREKLLEHFVAWKLLGMENSFQGTYVDVASCSSPWAIILRHKGIEAFAIDLAVPPSYSGLDHYRQEDATQTSFTNNSIGGASLQCAYEMFLGSHDIDLLKELSRILTPGGRAVISPLYMHTTACFYQTPEFYGKLDGDPGSTGFIRRDCWGVPASRKYSPETFRDRVWNNAIHFGLLPSLWVLRNRDELGEGIYLHFILILDKQGEKSNR